MGPLSQIVSVREFCEWKNRTVRWKEISIKENFLARFERHVFVCTNMREPGSARPSCAANGSNDLHKMLKDAAKDAGLGNRVRINKSGCLEQCEHGTTVVVYPEAVWYGFVKPGNIQQIVSEHLVGGKPVESLILAEDCLNTPACPHREPPKPLT